MFFTLSLLVFTSFYASENNHLSDQVSLADVKKSYLNNRELYVKGRVYFYDSLSNKAQSFPYDKNSQNQINSLVFNTKRGSFKSIFNSDDIIFILKDNNIYTEYQNRVNSSSKCNIL